MTDKNKFKQPLKSKPYFSSENEQSLSSSPKHSIESSYAHSNRRKNSDFYLEEEQDDELMYDDDMNEETDEPIEQPLIPERSEKPNPTTAMGLLSRLSEVYQSIYQAEKDVYQIRQEILDNSGGSDLFAVATEISDDFAKFLSSLSSIEKSIYGCKEEILSLAIDIKELSKETSKSKSK